MLTEPPTAVQGRWTLHTISVAKTFPPQAAGLRAYFALLVLVFSVLFVFACVSLFLSLSLSLSFCHSVILPFCHSFSASVCECADRRPPPASTVVKKLPVGGPHQSDSADVSELRLVITRLQNQLERAHADIEALKLGESV